jgi:pantoate kinase
MALNEALGTDMGLEETAKIAHIAEIECHTGLGSVTAAMIGGFGVSYIPGGPGINWSKKFEDTRNLRTVYLHFGPFPTKKALLDPIIRKRINDLGNKYVDELYDLFTPERFMDFSRSFAEHVGLITPRIRRIFEIMDRAGYKCTMAMFGEVVFRVLEFEEVNNFVDVLEASTPGYQAMVCCIDDKGARVTSK